MEMGIFLPLFIIGIPPHMYVTVAGLNLVYQFWVHGAYW